MLNDLLADYDRLNYILGPFEGCGEMIDGLREELGVPEGAKRGQIVVALIRRINAIKAEIKSLGGFPEDWVPVYEPPGAPVPAVVALTDYHDSKAAVEREDNDWWASPFNPANQN